MSRRLAPALQVERELKDITVHLMSKSLVDDQNFAAARKRDGGIIVVEADYWSSDEAPRSMAKMPYPELYERLAVTRSFDLRFLDGALVQVRYEFSDTALRRSRLAFFPSPDLTPYQTDPELYLHQEMFGEVVDARVVTVPLRFDFDGRPGSVVELHHPHSHLTLGQYPHCRVPVTGGVSPHYFIEFIIRSFYRTAVDSGTDDLPGPYLSFPSTITPLESSLVHIGLKATP